MEIVLLKNVGVEKFSSGKYANFEKSKFKKNIQFLKKMQILRQFVKVRTRRTEHQTGPN
jgi:hypothetical protein